MRPSARSTTARLPSASASCGRVGNGPVEGLQGLGRTAQGQQSFAFCHEQVGLIGPQLQRRVVVEKRKPRPSRREIGVPARHMDKSAPLRRSSPQHVGIAIDLGHRRRAMTHEERAVRHSSFQELASPFSPAHSRPGPVRANPTCRGSRHALRWHRKPSDGLPGISRTAAPMLQDHRYASGPLPAGRKAPDRIPAPAAGASPRPLPPSTCARLARPPVRPEPPVRRSAPEASTRASTCLSVEMPLRAVTDGRSVGCPDHGIRHSSWRGTERLLRHAQGRGAESRAGSAACAVARANACLASEGAKPGPDRLRPSQAYGRHDEAVVVLADLRTAVAGARREPGRSTLPPIRCRRGRHVSSGRSPSMR